MKSSPIPRWTPTRFVLGLDQNNGLGRTLLSCTEVLNMTLLPVFSAMTYESLNVSSSVHFVSIYSYICHSCMVFLLYGSSCVSSNHPSDLNCRCRHRNDMVSLRYEFAYVPPRVPFVRIYSYIFHSCMVFLRYGSSYVSPNGPSDLN